MPEQPRLFPYENPLRLLKGRAFFAQVPTDPGIYRMLGVRGELLYVGKAKNLRTRLRSYALAKPGQVSRKVIRMIHLVQEIEWETCDSETAALLRENELLRQLKPPFNVVNTSPESYYFVGLRWISGQVRFRLTCSPKRQSDLLFGTFKGRARVREAFSALLRLIWAAQNAPARFEFPPKLTRRIPPSLYSVNVPAEWDLDLKRFFRGIDSQLLIKLTERLLEQENIPPFAYRLIQEDIERAGDFFAYGPQRNRHLRTQHGSTRKIGRDLIGQDEIDDLLVLERARKLG